MRYPAIAGLTYKVWYCNKLGDPWTELTNEITGDGSFKQTADLSEEMPKSRFYKVTIDLP